jgi:dCTP deaminase
MVPAADLRPGDRLMPLYRRVFRGYEMVYQPLTGCYYPTHRLADEWNLRHGIYPDLPNTHRHHLDGNRRNNMPCNIVRVPASEHLRHHNATRNFNPERHRLRLLATFAQLRQNPDWWASFCEKQRCQAIRFWQDEKYQAARQALREKRRAYWTEERRQERSVAYRQWWEMNPERRQELVAEFRLQRNHQVVAIRELKGEHDVFCLTVPEAGNFALEAGIFVHNCGIVVNVTPLEPEWEGHVTIEISNTTPLPAKVYANEGIAQVIFLSADELCEVSYADRKGKYQGQQGIVPPKVE